MQSKHTQSAHCSSVPSLNPPATRDDEESELKSHRASCSRTGTFILERCCSAVEAPSRWRVVDASSNICRCSLPRRRLDGVRIRDTGAGGGGDPGSILLAGPQVGLSGQLPILDLSAVHGHRERDRRILRHQSDACIRRSAARSLSAAILNSWPATLAIQISRCEEPCDCAIHASTMPHWNSFSRARNDDATTALAPRRSPRTPQERSYTDILSAMPVNVTRLGVGVSPLRSSRARACAFSTTCSVTTIEREAARPWTREATFTVWPK